ncbi:hypothetical protein [Chenggangzhangella methanolivorans]|uniref:Uncharacterized protein n=1 Tax=Chenggangzhangella methanolivorans TaxID=1437009 RepID=A0A9E6RDP8_9HYPH|nr:hypothetical protein [Chenggangzhangella methanolivorans]QZN98896.1 hypothetical protein K6K41_18500 [Chenggangzhangella methanolivorans]
MYHEDAVVTPRDTDHFWVLVEENIGYLRTVLGARIESEEEALAGTFREGDNNKLTGMMMIAHAGTSEANDMRYYFHFVGNDALKIVEEGLANRKLSIEFCQAWGVAHCAHGYLAAWSAP